MPATDDRVIAYSFTLMDRSVAHFSLAIDPDEFTLREPSKKPDAQWLLLDTQQCPNCPLTAATQPHCPAALQLEPVLKAFNASTSHDPVALTVVMPERTIISETTVQKGLSSLIGLIFPLSGCPRLAPLRAMAWFHLPLASFPETLFRSTGMYLLGQYFRHKAGDAPDWDMSGLAGIYRQLETVNLSMSRRLRLASRTDSSINAVIILDMLAKMLPDALEDALEELHPLFEPLAAQDATTGGLDEK